MKNLLYLFITCLILSFITPSCSWFKHKEEKTADQLATEGMDYFKSKKFFKALESFEKIRDWYPFSKFSILAELKIADCHYEMKEYEEAAHAYEEFENLHPNNDAIPYVIYQRGHCYFINVDTIDRDQSATQKAIEIFTQLINSYPSNEYALKAKENIKDCRRILAGHEFYVGHFYYKSKHYKGALSRFKTVFENFPDIKDIHNKASEYISLCEKKITEK
ncbi:MAG: outer membrane protein assembly factor BamD [Desulfobacterales bacterium]|nr:outer membrane protein assembly factor BamD [Desulfobacterales bacterium]